MQPMPRAGGVRAFSHLPEPVRVQADFEGPLSTRPATPAGRPRPYVGPEADVEANDDQDTFHAPVPDSDHADDTRAYEYQDDTPWHQPRITAQDLPPQSHDEDAHGSSLNRPTRSSGFDNAHSAERSISSTRDSGFSPSPLDFRDAFHSPTPDSPAGQAPAQDNRPALPGGRLFERRLTPGHRSLADTAESYDLVDRTQGGPSSRPAFQTLAAASQPPGKPQIPLIQPDASGRKDPLAPPPPKQDTPKPDTGGRSDTKTPPPQQKPNPTPAPPAQASPPAPSTAGPQNGRSNMTVDDDKNTPFAATVRSAMERELKDSPSSAALLNAVKGLPNKIRIVPKIAGQANTTLLADGTIVISVNTRDMTGATMSHELAHAIQQAVYYNTLKELAQKGEDPKKKETIDKAVQAGRDALHQVLPVQNKSDQGQEFKENEAMRGGHVVNAEHTAAEIGARIGENSTLSPDEIAEMFWLEQKKKEDSKHINNGLIIPKGTKYGDYDYGPVLKSLGHGVTREHLDKARKKVIPNGW